VCRYSRKGIGKTFVETIVETFVERCRYYMTLHIFRILNPNIEFCPGFYLENIGEGFYHH
jgi:hypothetical protein